MARVHCGPWRAAGWLVWVAVLVTVSVIAAVDTPPRRTVTGVYRWASDDWQSGQDLYAPEVHGFLYLPASAVIYTPFARLSAPIGEMPLGEMLWRAIGVSLLALGMWRLCARLGGGRRDAVFLAATLLAVPAAWNAIRNGQANVHLGALMIHGALDVAERRWTRAAVGLSLALAIKPLALVLIFLLAALERPMRWRLALGILLVLALPFLTASPDYVLRQYELGFAKMGRASTPGPPYTEMFGGLHHLGLDVSTPMRMAVRLLAAGVALGLSVWARRRWGSADGAVFALGWAVAYLMAFNPATEANSYVMLAAVMAPFAASALAEQRRLEGGLLLGACVLLWTDLTGAWLHDPTKRWLKPLIALIFALYLVVRARARPAHSLRGGPSTSGGHARGASS